MEQFKEWYKAHLKNEEFSANQTGLSGNMEFYAIIQMFKRSIEKFGVIYDKYIGDADSKTYGGLVIEKNYGNRVKLKKKHAADI